ncbi:hypothetical protein [Nitrosovibrio sp. Nv4]|uniref:hypothetical protein n=1 Tax=Nitrosovibrio sp. Nv4 TaxID=1945880 RepID=UPI000BC4BFFF|nr:hypothetical protein [Nitrosovibrio sp. Nv4]SOD41899.1 hypothetical protein SAMN06298226_2210 [Nitrosovibrio sp. Nv4]
MDQNKYKKRYISYWHVYLMIVADWLVFVVPVSLIGILWMESVVGPGNVKYRDFRILAHWIDPVLFQYNLIMSLLAMLVIPTLALSYTLTMANRKERRLQNEVPVERRAELVGRMRHRTSFSAYRGGVWMATTVVLLGMTSLLLFNPSCGLIGSLGANSLLMGPFAELYEQNQHAFNSHLLRTTSAFQFGFLGAYVYFIGSVVRAYFTYDLTSHTFVEGAMRMIAASLLALVLSFAFIFFLSIDEAAPASTVGHGAECPKPWSTTESLLPTAASTTDKRPEGNSDDGGTAIPVSVSLIPIVAYFFGFYPKRASLAVERIALRIFRNIISGDSYRALPLSMLAGMSYAHELRLEREGYDNIENLSNADAVDLAIRTCFSYGQSKRWIDQAWLATHLREDYPAFVFRTAITSSDELQRFLITCDSAQVDGVEQLVNGLSTDPAVISSWKVRLTTLKILLNADSAPLENSGNPDTNKHGSD